MNAEEGRGAAEPEPVQLVDDADAHEFDDMDGDLDEFGNDIHEDVADVAEEDLDADIGEGSDHRRLSRVWDDEAGEDDDEDNDAEDDDDEEFYADAGFPGGMHSFGIHGRFGELGNLHDDEDDDEEHGHDHADDEDDEDDDDGAGADAGIGAGIQGLLDIHRQLHNLPNDNAANDENIRRHPLMNALRGVFPLDGGLGRLGQLGLIDPRMGRIMAMLKSNNNSEITVALDDLSNILIMSPSGMMELPTFPVEGVARSLVQLLQQSQNSEVLVKTARAIAHLVDNGFEGSLRALINAGIVPALRQTFENLEYIDIVEHLIQVLKPLAIIEPKLMLESGCLLPCLNIMEFFGGNHIQKQILGAVDACAHAVSASTLGPARELLAALPSPPSELIVGTVCQLISAIAKRSPPESDLREIVSSTMWETLVSYISPQTPHVSRVLRACSHTASRCPEYVQSRSALASLVSATLSQGAQDPFSAFLATPKETLFSGLKLLQVLLPPPPPIGPFTGPYRKPASSTPELHLTSDEAHDYALSAIPTAMTIYGATTNTPVRQLALLVVVQAAAAHPANFSQLVSKLQLTSFAAQVVGEGDDTLALTVGGLDLAWEIASDSDSLAELSATGISADLEDISGDAEPVGTYSATDNLRPVAEYLARGILTRLRAHLVAGDYSDLLDEVKRGSINPTKLADAPLPELLRAGLLDALKQAGELALRKNLSFSLVSLLQGAVGRLERFQLQLAPGHTTSVLEEAVGRTEKVRITDRNYPHTGWVVNVPSVATLRVLGEFLREKFTSRRVTEAEQLQRPHFAYYVSGERVPSDVSVLKAVYNQLNHNSHEIPHIQFERVSQAEQPASKPDPDLSRYGDLGDAIRLLAILAHENEARNEPVPWQSFQNSKLTAKLTRQMADCLVVAASLLPQWTYDTVLQAPFLYPLRTRLHFVQLTSCGLGRNLRLLRQMQERGGDDGDEAGGEPDDDERTLGRHRRQKYRLYRDKLLEGALRLLEMSCKNPAVLDVMFYGEEGTGRGPTQEFFALASRELSNSNLGIWRETPTGIFPAAKAPTPAEQRIFEGVGRLMARALLDKRILDFRLNPAFFSIVLGSPPTLDTLRRVDAQLAASLEHILAGQASDVNAMGIDFTLPGTDIELVPNGSNIFITAENAGDYVARVVDIVIGTGISKQIEAFRKGFGSTISVSALHAFMTDELVTLCGAGHAEDWSEAALLEAFRADHGYNMHSVPVQSLVRVLASFDSAERRKFLMFATGSPHLPIGGFKALNPPFTVVAKHPENDGVELDRYLPSVMTCVNYLKLPEYSSEEVMRTQLKLAMTEGSEAFPLS